MRKDDDRRVRSVSREVLLQPLALSIDIDKLTASKKTTGKDTALGIRSIGIIDQDKNAIYMGLLATYALEPGKPVDVASVTGMTTLGRRVLSFNLNRPFKNRKTYDSLLAQVRQVMADAVAANKGPALEEGVSAAMPVEPPAAATTLEPPSRPGRQARLVIAGAILAVIAVGIGIASYVARIRKRNSTVAGRSQPYEASI
jgi:hypothetical protein